MHVNWTDISICKNLWKQEDFVMLLAFSFWKRTSLMLLTHCKNSCNHMGFVRLSKKRFKSAVSRSFSSRKHPILTDSKDWCFNWKPRFLIIRGLSVSTSICSALRSTSADHILYNSAWLWLYDDDDDDIYIMMQCLCVTKNHHFLKRSVCLFCNVLSSLL